MLRQKRCQVRAPGVLPSLSAARHSLPALMFISAEQRQQQGRGAPSIEGISAAARAAKAAYLGPLLRAVLAWTTAQNRSVEELRDACL